METADLLTQAIQTHQKLTSEQFRKSHSTGPDHIGPVVLELSEFFRGVEQPGGKPSLHVQFLQVTGKEVVLAQVNSEERIILNGRGTCRVTKKGIELISFRAAIEAFSDRAYETPGWPLKEPHLLVPFVYNDIERLARELLEAA